MLPFSKGTTEVLLFSEVPAGQPTTAAAGRQFPMSVLSIEDAAKLESLLAQLVRQDWPEGWPDFLPSL